MDYNIPRHVSAATLLRATRLAKNAESMDLHPGNARWGERGDYLVFMFKNKYEDVVLIFCTPYSYIVELNEHDDFGHVSVSYFMLKNIRNWLFKIRSLGYYDCEPTKKEENE